MYCGGRFVSVLCRHSWHHLEPCGYGSVATKTSYVEILNFRHFFKHIVFTSEKDKIRNKEIKNYVNVSVVVDIECLNAKLEAL